MSQEEIHEHLTPEYILLFMARWELRILNINGLFTLDTNQWFCYIGMHETPQQAVTYAILTKLHKDQEPDPPFPQREFTVSFVREEDRSLVGRGIGSMPTWVTSILSELNMVDYFESDTTQETYKIELERLVSNIPEFPREVLLLNKPVTAYFTAINHLTDKIKELISKK